MSLQQGFPREQKNNEHVSRRNSARVAAEIDFYAQKLFRCRLVGTPRNVTGHVVVREFQMTGACQQKAPAHVCTFLALFRVKITGFCAYEDDPFPLYGYLWLLDTYRQRMPELHLKSLLGLHDVLVRLGPKTLQQKHVCVISVA